MRYTLRQLEVFLATARHENVTRAAKTLAMSQSAASGALSELESQFDVKLFDRLGKRLQLSELGKQLRPQAERLLDQAQAFEQGLAGEDAVGDVDASAQGADPAAEGAAERKRRDEDTDGDVEHRHRERVPADGRGCRGEHVHLQEELRRRGAIDREGGGGE